jgi:ankyrin repeat protein
MSQNADVRTACQKLGDAAECGDVDAITRLLQAGANVKATDWGGYTALHRAAFNGHDDCCEVLIKGGAVAMLRKSRDLHPVSADICSVIS